MKCIIPCAGESSRMRYVPKHLVSIKGKPLIQHVVNTWKDSIDQFIFVLGKNMTYMWEFLPSNSAVVFQEEPKGLADAILQAEPLISFEERFMVTLGDCLYKGKFVKRERDYGVGVWSTPDLEEINKSYAVKTWGCYVSEVIEKPHFQEGPANCGMGVYFFPPRVFQYILEYQGPAGGGDLTQIIQNMIDSGEKIEPVWFEGKYTNVGSPGDIEKAEKVLE